MFVTFLVENRRNDSGIVTTTMVAGPSIPNSTSCDIHKEDGSDKNQNDPYKDISINFNGLENGMEFLSVAAGVTAKDKRIKDAKNQVAANKENKEMVANFSSMFVPLLLVDEVFFISILLLQNLSIWKTF